MLRAAGRVLLGTLTAAWATALPAVATAATDGVSSVTMVSEVGDYIGGGASRVWRDGDGTVSVGGSVTGTVSVSVNGGASGDYFTLTFAAAPGAELVAGSYVDAQRTPFRTAGHPGIDVSGSGRGCNKTSGRFTVLDVTPDLSRLWLLYEQHCEGGTAALFGEVRVGFADADPGLAIVPGRVAWPAEYVGSAGRPVPVTLVNTGGAPVTVSGAAVTEGAADFAVTGTTCATLDPGASCAVYVRFAPSGSGRRTGTLTVEDSTAAGSRTVRLDGTGIADLPTWQMHSETGDYIGGGRDWSYSAASSTFGARGNESAVHLSLRSGGDWWDAHFAADASNVLVPGATFAGATRYPVHAPGAGLDISGVGRGCNTLTGSFTVDDVTWHGSALQRLAVRFEQHCEGGPAALTGTIDWTTDQPAEPLVLLPVGPPPAVGDLSARGTVGGLALSWDDPGSAGWVATEVRHAPGVVPPATVSDGGAVYSGRAGTVLVSDLAPGTAHSFAVFPRGSGGVVGPAATLTVRGSDLRATAAPAALVVGSTTSLGGRLVDPDSAAGVPGAVVRVYRRPAGASPWALHGTATTGSDGRWAVSAAPTANTEYRAQFAGATGRLGDSAGPLG